MSYLIVAVICLSLGILLGGMWCSCMQINQRQAIECDHAETAFHHEADGLHEVCRKCGKPSDIPGGWTA